jgi:hypothetical protein
MTGHLALMKRNFNKKKIKDIGSSMELIATSLSNHQLKI